MNDVRLDSLSRAECLQYLRVGSVGRIALVLDDGPVILPVNYKLVESQSGPLIVLRTRPGNVIERSRPAVAFEIDGVDLVRHQSWSVLVRGDLLHTSPNSAGFRGRDDPEPWLAERDSWLLVDPWDIGGRDLRGNEPLTYFRNEG